MKKWISPSRRVTSVFLLAMLLAAFIPILCGWIFYTRSSSVTAAQEKQMHEKSLQIVLQRFGDSLDEITNRCVTLAYDLRGMNFPAQDALTAHDRLAIHDAAKKLETVRSSLSVNADALYLFSPDSGFRELPDDQPDVFHGHLVRFCLDIFLVIGTQCQLGDDRDRPRVDQVRQLFILWDQLIVG